MREDTRPYLPYVDIRLINCQKCFNHFTERTPRSGYAMDHLCQGCPDPKGDHGFKVIAGYVEWPSEAPQDHQIPAWCPFAKGDAGMDFLPIP